MNSGLVIRNTRKRADLTQEALAEKAGVDVRTIRRIEKNERVGEGSLIAVCEALNISIEKPDEDRIRTPKKAILLPNVKSARDLAHLLIGAEHVEVENQVRSSFHDDFEEEWVVDNFLENSKELCGAWNADNPEQNKRILSFLQSQLDILHKRNIYLSGSCTDSLVNDFKFTELIIFKF